MINRATRLVATVILVAILFVTFFGKLTNPTWAFDQVIEAMQKYKACNLTVIESSGLMFDCWARAEPSGELSDEVILKGTNGAVVWVKDGKTYYYDPHRGTVEVNDAKTAGFSPWLGPELFKLVSKADDAQTVFGKDPTTGRGRVVMTGSLTTTFGPMSWSIEFDRETRLPISFTQWDNTTRSGAPKLSIPKITYFEDVPDAFFAVDIPPNVTYTPKPVVLPEANVALLGSPRDGIRTEGLTQDEAAHQILEQIYKASMDGDLQMMRKLCPLTARWSDELLKAVIMPDEEGKRLAEVVKIGTICREGSSRLGPFVVVPTRLKTRDGRVWDEKQIVQFRRIDGQESCVVYGPYGMVSEVKQ
ncbi:MAG: hypothetical protein JW955_25105 [Sedimentisphaerales bacterium]|nr:hypothetical protein [Sedimentisphaerales bacterium]